MQICVWKVELNALELNTTIFFDQTKRKLLLTFCTICCTSASVFCQEFLNNIERAIKQGSAKNLEVYFDNSIDLSFSEKTDTYPRKQAEIIIQKFFTKVEPKDFIKVNIGTSHANNTIYYIGTLSTSNGSYQVYMFFVIKNATYVMKELRFEKV